MIRAYIVDDEEPARDRLRRLLSEVEGVCVVGEASDGEEALRQIPRLAPDLVFLDIQMPGKTGMEVAATLPPPRPGFIFCTAFDQYAIQAFEQHAVDYLLKPLNRDRLASALGRIREARRSRERIEAEMALASATQARFYPSAVTGMATLEASGACRAAREVGGDYYDFIPLGKGRTALAVGDVSGKGLFAGLLMAGLQGRLQALAPRYQDDLVPLFDELNRAMFRIADHHRYATLFYGVYEEPAGRLTYINAGHPAPLLLRGTAASSEGLPGTTALAPTGTVVGLLPEPRFAQETTRLYSGDSLLIFSDGLIETRNPQGAELGVCGVEAAARVGFHESPIVLLDRILGQADQFRSGGELEDDVTLVVAKVR